MRSAWLIYNPAAGRFPAGWLLSRAVGVLHEAGWEIEVREAQHGGHLGELAQQAVEAGCQAVFVAGGDGSVGRVASTLSGTDVALGVLPAGTANVWAKEIGIERLDWIHLFALEKAAGRLARGEVHKVDMGTANGQAFLLWAGIGLDAEIVSRIEPRQRWEKVFGPVHYGLLALWQSIGWEGVELRVQAGDQVWEDRYLVAIASNIRTYAGGLVELSPDAKFDDGKLDFWLIGGRSLKDAVTRVVQILLGMHVDAPDVVHFQAEEAVFESDSEIHMHFDGEPEVLKSPLQFQTLPSSLNVLMPEPEAG
ncbi:MAG: diacylglycerol kinase family lipid kinase [Anaerolineae bacterium]|nr:MAG: diacylglycerol kinase family lipid kinase [Anaerolineae bacterium]